MQSNDKPILRSIRLGRDIGLKIQIEADFRL